ncbi:MAG TPA: BTAD domain-containing putative transcriptional regulator [Ktedonobacteraceae bacterium]|nr:BTAD domain-containing putative transcriptional regulator [Ktedonobacteraceae bacterium]
MGEPTSRIEDMATPTFVRIWMCGPLLVEYLNKQGYEELPISAWRGRRSPRLLLKALLCAPGRQMQREALPALLWPDSPPSKQELSCASSILRHILRDPVTNRSLLLTENSGQFYRLDTLWCDADAALWCLDQAEKHGKTTDEAFPWLQQAESYFKRGMLLQGDEFAWIHGPRNRVAAARYRCRRWLVEAYVHRGQSGQAESLLNDLLREEPMDEEVIYRLMEIFCQQSMRGHALKLFEEAQERFRAQPQKMSSTLLAYADRLKNT